MSFRSFWSAEKQRLACIYVLQDVESEKCMGTIVLCAAHLTLLYICILLRKVDSVWVHLHTHAAHLW